MRGGKILFDAIHCKCCVNMISRNVVSIRVAITKDISTFPILALECDVLFGKAFSGRALLHATLSGSHKIQCRYPQYRAYVAIVVNSSPISQTRDAIPACIAGAFCEPVRSCFPSNVSRRERVRCSGYSFPRQVALGLLLPSQSADFGCDGFNP
jgi:hypothetical protein